MEYPWWMIETAEPLDTDGFSESRGRLQLPFRPYVRKVDHQRDGRGPRGGVPLTPLQARARRSVSRSI